MNLDPKAQHDLSLPNKEEIQFQKIWDTHLPPIPPNSELESALNTLTDIILILDIPDASFVNYSNAIYRMSNNRLELSRSLNRLTQVETELKEHLSALKHENELLKHWNDTLIPGSANGIFPDPPIALERRKESLVKRAKEYHRELETVLKQQPLEVPTTINQYLAQKEMNSQLEKLLKEKRAKVTAFRGLPPNLELARHELLMAREKQNELFHLRERLLRNMADSVL